MNGDAKRSALEAALSKAVLDMVDTDCDGAPTIVVQSITVAEIVRTGSAQKELVTRTTGDPPSWALLGMLDVGISVIQDSVQASLTGADDDD